MNPKTIYLGNAVVNCIRQEVLGEFAETENEIFYRISNSNLKPDFFLPFVSDSDHRMFISSNGSLTTLRKDPINALFPYFTTDNIQESKGITERKA